LPALFARPWRIREGGASLRGIFTKIQQRNPVNAPSHAANSKPAVLSRPPGGAFGERTIFGPKSEIRRKPSSANRVKTLGFAL